MAHSVGQNASIQGEIRKWIREPTGQRTYTEGQRSLDTINARKDHCQVAKEEKIHNQRFFFFVPVFFDSIKCLNELSTFLPIQCRMSSRIAVLHSASSFYLASKATEIEFETLLFCFSVFYCQQFPLSYRQLDFKAMK